MSKRKYLVHDCHRLFTHPRPHSGPHLKNDAADTPDINLEIITFLLSVDDLRRHPKNGALQRCEGTAMEVFCPFGNSEIRYLACPRHFDQNIVGFQILNQKSEEKKETGR